MDKLDPKLKQFIGWIIVVLVVVGVDLVFDYAIPIPAMPNPFDQQQALGITHFSGMAVEAPTSQATGEPAMLVDNDGVSNILEVLDGGTPALVVDSSGNTTISGTCSGCSVNSATGLRITQPTAAATATPALAINSLAAGAKLLEVSDSATPVFNILNGGAWSSTGAGTHSGGQTTNNWAIVSAPTAIATATPAAVVDSAGVSIILEVRDAATPVFSIHNGGVIDVQGNQIDLDADADTSITADTDDQIDIEISGADDFKFTANTFTILAGSKIASASITTGTHGIVFVATGTHGHASTETAVSLISIPANANVVDVTYAVTTQWNDNASAVVDCGIEGGDVDAFVDNMNINDGADVNRMGDAADMAYASSFIDVGASDVDVICQVAEGDNDASAGAATLTIWYIID